MTTLPSEAPEIEPPTSGRDRTFHPLRLVDRRAVAADAAELTFAVPAALAAAFAGEPGQHVAVRATIDGVEFRRSYSLSRIAPGCVSIAVRRVPDGAISTFLHDVVDVGDSVDLMPPVGAFVLPADRVGGRFGFAAAGSGIVPIVALMEAALEAPSTSVTLLYVNRSSATAMFADRLHDLRHRHPARCQFLFVTTREPRSVGLLGRRPDRATIASLLEHGALGLADHWFVCGPDDFSSQVLAALDAAGVARDAIHRESYGAAPGRGIPPLAGGRTASLELTFRGRTTTTTIEEGDTLLTASVRARPDVPYSCQTGTCATCRCRVVGGEVAMTDAVSLTEHEREAGFVLACRSVARSPHVQLDFDHH